MDRASDPAMRVMEETKVKTVGVSGARGAVAVLPAEEVNNSGRGAAKKQNAMESTGWRELATLSPVKVGGLFRTSFVTSFHNVYAFLQVNGDAGVIGRHVRCLVALERELVPDNVFRCRATYSSEMIARDKVLSTIPARCPAAIVSHCHCHC